MKLIVHRALTRNVATTLVENQLMCSMFVWKVQVLVDVHRYHGKLIRINAQNVVLYQAIVKSKNLFGVDACFGIGLN